MKRRRSLGHSLRAGGVLVGSAVLPRWSAGAPALVTSEAARPRAEYGAAVGDVADNPLSPEVVLEDGTVWRNLVTPAKAKVAETLDEFRGNHLYNRLDTHVRAFEAEASQVVLWDHHEVLSLEDPSLLWMRGRDGAWDRVVLPPVGGKLTLPPVTIRLF
jgi:phosphodiesterase/alkaline phosphatase D-like protein